MAEPLKIADDPVTYITNLYDAVKRWRDPYEKRWKRFYKLYRSYRDPSQYPFKANVFVPYIFSIVESVVPKMLGTIFNTRPILSVIPRKGASEGVSKLLERLLDYQLDEDQLEFFNKILEFFKETAVYGTAFMKILPRFHNDELVSFNYIDVEPIDLFHIFPDYRATSVGDMRYIIQLSYLDFDELKDMQDQGFYKNVTPLLEKLEAMTNVDEYKRKRLSDIGILDEYGFDASRRVVEVLEYWDRDNIYIIGGRQEVLKKEKNPFGRLLPFIMARYIPIQHELYGVGIPEVSESLQEELNTVRNQRMDNVNLIINRMFVVNKYADVDFDSLVSFPGNVILSNDVEAIKPLDTRDITKSAYEEEDIIKRDIDNATGEWEYSRGATPPRRETATGIVRLQQASNIRFDTIVKMLEFSVLRNIAKMFIWLDYQFMDPADFKGIVGEEEYKKYEGDMFYKSTPTEVFRNFMFQPMGSSTTAIKEVRVNQIMQAYEMFNKDPFINQIELRKMVMDVLDLKNESKLLIEDPVQYAQLLMQMTGQVPGGPQGQPPTGEGGGGPSPPNGPSPPKPGEMPQTGERQLAEMNRVAGGGLIKKGPAAPGQQ